MAQTLKGYTSRDANRLLRRTGEPFWQAESYDHWVRDGRELERIRDNIENKPREPGLVARPADYPDQRQKAEMNLGAALRAHGLGFTWLAAAVLGAPV